MPQQGDPEPPVPTPTSASSGSHNRVKSVNTEKAASVKTSRSSTRYATDRPSSSVSKAKSSKLHRDAAQNKYIVNPYIYQMTKMALASPTMMHWSRAPVSGMLPTRHLRAHSMTLVGSTIWIFGGTDESDSRDDVYTLDTETFVWGKPKPTGECPPPSRAHTATLVQDRFIFIVGGGQDFVYYNTLYIFDTLTHKWTCPDIQGEKPIPRRAHTACLHNGRLFIFGGESQGGNGTFALNDVWAMDVTVPFTQLRWEQIKPRGGPIPRPRGYHTSNLVGNVMVIIGGHGAMERSPDGRKVFLHVPFVDSGGLIPVRIGRTQHPVIRLGPGVVQSWQVRSFSSVAPASNPVNWPGLTLTLRALNGFGSIVTLQYESRQSAGRIFPARGYHGAVLADSRLIVTVRNLALQIIKPGGFDGEIVFDDVSILDLAALAYLPQVTRFGIIIDERGVYVEDEGAEYNEEVYIE